MINSIIFWFIIQRQFSLDIDCIPQNILITLGDYFANEESDNIYKVSFMQNKQDCKEDLILKVFNDDNVQSFQIKGKRNYDFKGSSWDVQVDYHRQFGMFELDNLLNPLEFTYGIYIGDRMLSGPFFFKSNIANYNAKSFKFISFGDQDLSVGSANLDRLKHEDFDMIILLGDYAYDIEENNGQKGDYYFSQMEEIFSIVPTLLVPGNHEYLDNTKFFASRFWFPGTTQILDNNIYAFTIQNSFFLAYNTDYMMMNKNKQQQFLKLVESYLIHSKNFKFKFFINHRPLICTQLYWDTKECQLSILYQKDLSDLLMKYNIDIVLSGHIHDYERLTQMNDYQFQEQGYKQFIIGSGGSEHSFGPIPKQSREFLERQIQDTVGYALIEMTEDKFNFKFKESYTNKVLDEYEIDKTQTTNLKKFLIIFSILFIIIFVIVFVLWKRYDRNDDYSQI